MPDRIIRASILTSDSINTLSWPAEIFYRRLMSVVDDFGRYDARPAILRSSLYALKIDRVSEPDISKWMNECSEAGVVRCYSVDNKPYVELLKFDQRLRAQKSKFPAPCGHLSADVSRCQQPLSNATDTDTYSETSADNAPPANFNHLSNSNLFRKPNIPTKEDVLLAFKSMGGSKEMADSFFDKYEGTGWFLNGSPITNFKPLANKYIANWVKKDGDTPELLKTKQQSEWEKAVQRQQEKMKEDAQSR
jgi:hypothetical protein